MVKKINKIFRYSVSIDPTIKRSLVNFKKQIRKILENPKTWCIRFKEDNENPDFIIFLTTDSAINQACKLRGLSCADWSKNIIYINNDNWSKGSKKSGLNLEDYRIYVINHEIGHILGIHNHLKPKKGCKVPVMNQSTLGIGKGLPNMWPLRREQNLIRKLHNEK